MAYEALTAELDVRRDDWNAQPPNRDYVYINPDSRPGLEDHHSVGDYGYDLDGEPHGFLRAVQDDHLHRGRNGWTDGFYNVVIWRDGRICELRPLNAKSGPIQSLTVCFPGNYDRKHLTAAQKRSWHRLRQAAIADGVGVETAWHGQRDGTGCPGANTVAWKRNGHPYDEPEDDHEEDVLAELEPPLELAKSDEGNWYLLQWWPAHSFSYVDPSAFDRLHDRAKRSDVPYMTLREGEFPEEWLQGMREEPARE